MLCAFDEGVDTEGIFRSRASAEVTDPLGEMLLGHVEDVGLLWGAVK